MSMTAVIVVEDGMSISISMEGANYGQYFTFSDGTNTVRRGVRAGNIVEDVALTSTGFSGDFGVDWENRESEPI